MNRYALNSFNLMLLSLTLATGAGNAARVSYNDPTIAYNGAWTVMNDSNASAGAVMMSGTTGNTVTYHFSGDSIVLYRCLSPAGGQATVTIDGNNWGTISFTSPVATEQSPAVLDHLGAGNHTIVITVGTALNGGAAGAVTVDSFEWPTTFTPSSNQTSALATINQIRTQAGLPPAQLSAALDLAAQAHANYLAMNNAGGHNETPGMQDFTGVDPYNRALYFGYDVAGSEVANPGGDSSFAITGEWMATVYHRTPFLTWAFTDVGCGTAQTGANGGGDCDFGTRRASAPSSRSINTWPANNAAGTPTSFQVESPNPAPGISDQTTLGYPISLHIAQTANVTQGTDNVPANATLTGPNSQSVAVYYIDRNNDPNNEGLADNYYMVPQQNLAPNTSYTASMSGTDTMGHQFSQTWTFSTVAAATISGVGSNLNGSATDIIWSTAGPVVSTSVSYGPTTKYGSTVAGSVLGQNAWYVSLAGLAGGTYHYQITATDAAGVTFTTPDMTFVAPSIANAQVSVDFVAPDATGATFIWHTFGPVNSTVVNYGLTTSYGQNTTGLLQGSSSATAFFAVANGLTANTTYHYSITATDAQGNTNSSADATFTTSAQ